MATVKPDRTKRFVDDEEGFDVKELLIKYYRNWKLFVLSLTLGIGAAYLLNKYTPPVYKITSQFLIKEETNPMNLFDFGIAQGVLPKGQKIANEMIMLKSRALANDVLERLPFDVEYYQEGFFTHQEIYKKVPVSAELDWNHKQIVGGNVRIAWENNRVFTVELTDKEYLLYTPGEDRTEPIPRPELKTTAFRFDQWVELPFAKFRINVADTTNSGTITLKFRDRESLLAQYTGDHLEILPGDKTSSILNFTLETSQPQKGRDYLNMLMNVFLEKELDEKNSIASNTVNFIDSQLSGIADSLTRTESRLENFRSSNRTYNITSEGNTLFEKLSDLEKTLSEEKFKREYYKNLENYLVRENYADIVVPSGLGIEDPVLNKLIEELIRLQADKSRYLATQTESSPTVREASRKISDLSESIKEVLKNVSRNADHIISDIEKRVAKIESQFGKLPQTEQSLLSIKRQYALNENIYTFLLQRRAEADISLASNRASNKIIEPAVLNFLPNRIKPLLNYFIGVLLGIMIPVAILFLRDVFEVKVKDVSEVEGRLRVPIVGYIGRNDRYPPLFVMKNPKAGITEAFRSLRTNLNFVYPRSQKVAIMVTSTISGEGKTFCAINLASVYAVSGKKTVLMSCDLHKSFRYKDLSVTNAVGLSTYLSSQDEELSDVIQHTEYPGLDVIAPGPVPPNPSELIVSDRFEQLIGELKLRYDVIVMDGSPLGITNEALHVTKIADITLFVVRLEHSEKNFLNDINLLKENKGLKNLYVVVNDINAKFLQYKGYGYGYYAEDSKDKGIKKLLKKEKANADSVES